MPPELKSKKRVKELMDSVRKENSEPQKESKPQNTTEKLVKQASKGPEEKKTVLKKLEHAENQLKKTRQKKYQPNRPRSKVDDE